MEKMDNRAKRILRFLVEKTKKSENELIVEMAKIQTEIGSQTLTELAALLILARDYNIDVNSALVVSEPTVPIAEIVNHKNKKISIVGALVEISPAKEYTTKTGKRGKYLSTVLKDETGRARCVFWNKAADDFLAKKIGVGDVIKIHDARISRNTFTNEFEIHVNPFSDFVIIKRYAHQIEYNPEY